MCIFPPVVCFRQTSVEELVLFEVVLVRLLKKVIKVFDFGFDYLS
jgi:hypothetical protein